METITKEQWQLSTMLLAGLSYVILTIAAVSISETHKQAKVIAYQEDTMAYLTSRLLTTEQTLVEIEEDSRMLEELKQVGKQIEQ
jgi:hypothetical protein